MPNSLLQQRILPYLKQSKMYCDASQSTRRLVRYREIFHFVKKISDFLWIQRDNLYRFCWDIPLPKIFSKSALPGEKQGKI